MCCRFQDYQTKEVNVIISNPPYHKAVQHKEDIKQFDDMLNLEDLAQHSYRLLKDSGRMYLVIKAYRMIETIEIFKRFRFSVSKIQMIHHSLNHQASSVCLEFRKNGKDHCVICAPIINEGGNRE